jgi:hypothetical protein
MIAICIANRLGILIGGDMRLELVVGSASEHVVVFDWDQWRVCGGIRPDQRHILPSAACDAVC